LVDSRQQEWITEIGEREDHTTNNKMELTAAIQSLEFVSKLKSHEANELTVTLHTDSEYVMKGITVWIHNWQKKGWRTAGRKPVLNQELWQELLALTELVKSASWRIEWKYVAGHAGVPLNERADVIATSCADHLNPLLYDGPKDKYDRHN
jgi:ribonuclease HI